MLDRPLFVSPLANMEKRYPQETAHYLGITCETIPLG